MIRPLDGRRSESGWNLTRVFSSVFLSFLLVAAVGLAVVISRDDNNQIKMSVDVLKSTNSDARTQALWSRRQLRLEHEKEERILARNAKLADQLVVTDQSESALEDKYRSSEKAREEEFRKSVERYREEDSAEEEAASGSAAATKKLKKLDHAGYDTDFAAALRHEKQEQAGFSKSLEKARDDDGSHDGELQHQAKELERDRRREAMVSAADKLRRVDSVEKDRRRAEAVVEGKRGGNEDQEQAKPRHEADEASAGRPKVSRAGGGGGKKHHPTASAAEAAASSKAKDKSSDDDGSDGGGDDGGHATDSSDSDEQADGSKASGGEVGGGEEKEAAAAVSPKGGDSMRKLGVFGDDDLVQKYGGREAKEIARDRMLSKMKALQEKIQKDFSRVTAIGKRAGYLPPVPAPHV